MTFTESDLVPLKQALLSGVSSVTIQGRTVQFRSMTELKTLIAEIEKSIDANSVTPSLARPNKITATFSK